MTAAATIPTFRDPAGSLTLEADRAVRTIHPFARLPTLRFLESPFCQRLEARGDLIAATIDDSPSGLRLFHPRVPIPTYPWEWTPSQWRAAADLTITLCEEALAEGWILKDATPLNILFVGARPIFVDILSFEPHDPGSHLWIAYGQYIRTFLLPLLMHQMLNWPLASTIFRRDGYEPAELYASLGWQQRFSRAAFWPVTLPTWLERAQSTEPSPAPRNGTGDSGAASQRMKSKLRDLRYRTRSTTSSSRSSAWSSYSQTLTHYTPEQKEQKLKWIREVLTDLRPARVLDIGANTGEYSALAASMGCEVVAIERDAASAERLFSMSQSAGLSIQTIHADIARPTPAVGWENGESAALLPRLEAKCDMVMMLAVIHHLLLAEQVTLAAVAALCARLTLRYLLIEWIPTSDAMYQSLMRGREHLYGSLSEADLLAHCSSHFVLSAQHTLGNGRILFLFEKR